MSYGDGFDPWKFVWAMTEQQGGSFISDDLKTAQLNSPEVEKAVTGYFDLLTKHKIADPASVGWRNGDALAAFGSGKAAMLPMTTAQAIPSLDKTARQGQVRVRAAAHGRARPVPAPRQRQARRVDRVR